MRVQQLEILVNNCPPNSWQVTVCVPCLVMSRRTSILVSKLIYWHLLPNFSVLFETRFGKQAIQKLGQNRSSYLTEQISIIWSNNVSLKIFYLLDLRSCNSTLNTFRVQANARSCYWVDLALPASMHLSTLTYNAFNHAQAPALCQGQQTAVHRLWSSFQTWCKSTSKK